MDSFSLIDTHASVNQGQIVVIQNIASPPQTLFLNRNLNKIVDAFLDLAHRGFPYLAVDLDLSRPLDRRKGRNYR
jgi:hypothetical protein